MKRRKLLHTLIISLIGMGLSSCIYNDTYEECPLSVPSAFHITLTMPDVPRISAMTRTQDSRRVDFSIVNNLNLVLASENTIKQIYYFTGESISPDDGHISMTRSDLPMTSDENNNKRTITIVDPSGELLKGIDHVYTIANYGQKIDTGTVTELRMLQQIQGNGKPGEQADCAMFGEISVSSSSQEGQIQLQRTISMFSIKFNGKELNEGVEITPKSISLHNVPTSCFIGQDNQIGTNATKSVALGQVESIDWGTLTRANPYLGGHELEPNTLPLFMFENLQGANTNKGENQVYKCPEEYKGDVKNVAEVQAFLDRTQKYSYIQIEADYNYKNPNNANDKIGGTIVYRFLLGDNIYNDFNVRRNTYYQVTLNLKGHGGAAEDGKEIDGKLVINSEDLSWRVDMKVQDWGFVKDKFDFDAHAETGTIEVMGKNWKITAAKDENGNSVGTMSWLRFATDNGGTGWTEPTGNFYIASDGIIKYFIQPMTIGVEFDEKTDVNKKRSITITVQNTSTGATQEITFTQWTPIKITTNKGTVFMERFEEDPMQSWGCNNRDLTTKVMIKNIARSCSYNFGTDIGSQYENGNAIYITDGNLDAPAHLYCYKKSLIPNGAGGSQASYYVLPDQATLQAMIDYSKKNTVENMESLHYEEDYWTSSAEKSESKNTIYWDGKQKKFVSTNDRNAIKRTRAIYTTNSYGMISFN